MLVFYGREHITPLQKLATLMLMLWITYSNELFSSLLYHHLGIPLLPLQKMIYILLPLLFALEEARKRDKVFFPHLGSFIFLVFSFIFIEYLNLTKINSIRLDLIELWLWIYLFFFIMVNFHSSLTRISFVIDYFLIAVLISNIILLLSVIGILNYPISFGADGRPMGEENLNTWTDFSALAIVVLTILKILKDDYWYIKKRKVNLLIAFFTILPIVTGSRGSLAIIAFALGLYLINKYVKKKLIEVVIIFSVFVFIFYIAQEVFRLNYANFLFIRRFEQTSFESGRGVQIITSWFNFLSSPWIGVGYENAAASIFHSITRSNFQYTQILASSGIFFAVYYLVFNFKIFIQNTGNLKKIVFVLILSFILIKYVARRPDHTFAFIMYLSYNLNILFRNTVNPAGK